MDEGEDHLNGQGRWIFRSLGYDARMRPMFGKQVYYDTIWKRFDPDLETVT